MIKKLLFFSLIGTYSLHGSDRDGSGQYLTLEMSALNNQQEVFDHARLATSVSGDITDSPLNELYHLGFSRDAVLNSPDDLQDGERSKFDKYFPRRPRHDESIQKMFA